MSTTLKGILAGLLLGAALTFVLNVATLVSAVSTEKTASIAGIVTVDYVKGDRGGFDLSLNGQPGSILLVIGAAVLGGVVGARRSTAHGSDPSAPADTDAS